MSGIDKVHCRQTAFTDLPGITLVRESSSTVGHSWVAESVAVLQVRLETRFSQYSQLAASFRQGLPWQSAGTLGCCLTVVPDVVWGRRASGCSLW